LVERNSRLNRLYAHKKTWDLIVDVVETVKLNKKEATPFNDAVVNRLTELKSPPPPTENPYEIKCETKS